MLGAKAFANILNEFSSDSLGNFLGRLYRITLKDSLMATLITIEISHVLQTLRRHEFVTK